MFAAIIAGLIIGFIAALPPGPVGITAIKLSLSHKGDKFGIEYALGGGFCDFLFCLLAIFASSAAQAAINSFSEDYPLLMILFQITIILGFVIYGSITAFSKKKSFNLDNENNEPNSKLLQYLKSKGPFLLGVAVSLTNIPSPTYLPSFAILTANVHKLQLIENTALNNIIFSAAFGFGNFLWLYLLSFIVTHFKGKISDIALLRLKRFAGYTFIGFGTLFGYRLLTLTKWPEIIRIFFAF